MIEGEKEYLARKKRARKLHKKLKNGKTLKAQKIYHSIMGLTKDGDN